MCSLRRNRRVSVWHVSGWVAINRWFPSPYCIVSLIAAAVCTKFSTRLLRTVASPKQIKRPNVCFFQKFMSMWGTGGGWPTRKFLIWAFSSWRTKIWTFLPHLVEHAETINYMLKFLMDVFLNLQEQLQIFHVAFLRHLIWGSKVSGNWYSLSVVCC